MLFYALFSSYTFNFFYGDRYVEILTSQPQAYFWGMIIFGILAGGIIEIWLGKMKK